MTDVSVEEAEQTLRYRFNNHALLKEALTHASRAPTRVVSNERLEFLGDSVLGLIVCDYLYQTFPDLLEGDMTKIKSVAVSRKMCTVIAEKIGLQNLLRLGKGMQKDGELPPSLTAAVLESVLGAIYLDGGFEAARQFLLPMIEPIIQTAAISGHQQNFKSVLQHFAQERMSAMPIYVLLDEKGPDHAKCFEVCVQIGAQQFESSWGQSKKQAEQLAALNALDELGVAVADDDGEIRIVDDFDETSPVMA